MVSQLAAKRSISLNGQEIDRTPLLVPSFSSKGFPDISKIVSANSELISGPILVSAYDLHYGKIQPPFDFASLIFLDSGGYEAAKDHQFSDLSDTHEVEHSPEPWTPEWHSGVLAQWSSQVPTVFISYDHPRERVNFQEQVARAKTLFAGQPNIMRELLIKPSSPTQEYLHIPEIIDQMHSLAGFPVIGVTEKEIGGSIFERMKNIALLRKALTAVGLDKPIHVFGSLDTITTLLYFVSGADIFDGLTWLRFAYYEGHTVYRQSYGALRLPVKTRSKSVDPNCWNTNLGYLKEMEIDMRRFLSSHDFSSFTFHGDLIKRTYDAMIEEVT
jgi:hypothetical protein